MKKIKVVLVAVFLFLSLMVNVKAYSQSEAITKTQQVENTTIELINVLNQYGKQYGNDLIMVMDDQLLTGITSADYTANINLVIQALKNNGYNDAANALVNIKNTIVSKLNNIESGLDLIETYLIDSQDLGLIGNSDLFGQIKASVRNLKTPLNSIFTTYSNLNYNPLISKISNYSIDELINFSRQSFGMLDIFTSQIERVEKWQDIFYIYHLDDYNDYFDIYFDKYYSKVYSKYSNIYNKLENKLQARLDAKIQEIVDNTYELDPLSVANRNEALYKIMNYIVEIESEANNALNKAQSIIKIEQIINEINKESDKIINRFEESYEYVESYLLEFIDLVPKTAKDEKYIDIDYNEGLVVYDDYSNLKANYFINRLLANIGTLSLNNLYNQKVGTGSVIEINYNQIVVGSYTLVVKGDIKADGEIDITDIVDICNHMFGKKKLNDLSLIAANMDNDKDSTIDITDVVRLCDVIFKETK